MSGTSSPAGAERGYAGLVVRPAVDEDAAVAAVHDASPDGGAVGFRVTSLVPPGTPDGTAQLGALDVVAELPGAGVVGAARLGWGRLRAGGRSRPYALLSSLGVHPDHRRRGVAAALTRWRLEHAPELAGDGVVLLANVQRGNAASEANAERWASGWTGPAVTAPLPVAGREPRRSRFAVRPAAPDELGAVVAGHATFTATHAFAREWSRASLDAWLAARVGDAPVNHYLVATDAGGAVVAGLALREDALLRATRITRLPVGIALANVVLRAVPRDRVLRNLVVQHLWFAEGHLDAGAALVRHARWRWRERATHLLATVDTASPALAAFGLRPWTPTTVTRTAVGGSPPVGLGAAVEPIA